MDQRDCGMPTRAIFIERESRTRHLVGIHREQNQACHSTKQNRCKGEAVSSLTRNTYGHLPVDGGATQSTGDVIPSLPLQLLGFCLLLHSWKAPLSSDVLFRLHGAYHRKAGVATRRRTIQVWNEYLWHVEKVTCHIFRQFLQRHRKVYSFRARRFDAILTYCPSIFRAALTHALVRNHKVSCILIAMFILAIKVAPTLDHVLTQNKDRQKQTVIGAEFCLRYMKRCG